MTKVAGARPWRPGPLRLGGEEMPAHRRSQRPTTQQRRAPQAGWIALGIVVAVALVLTTRPGGGHTAVRPPRLVVARRLPSRAGPVTTLPRPQARRAIPRRPDRARPGANHHQAPPRATPPVGPLAALAVVPNRQDLTGAAPHTGAPSSVAVASFTPRRTNATSSRARVGPVPEAVSGVATVAVLSSAHPDKSPGMGVPRGARPGGGTGSRSGQGATSLTWSGVLAAGQAADAFTLPAATGVVVVISSPATLALRATCGLLHRATRGTGQLLLSLGRPPGACTLVLSRVREVAGGPPRGAAPYTVRVELGARGGS